MSPLKATALWGEAFEIKDSPKEAKKIIKKIKEPKEPVAVVKKQTSHMSIQERLRLIEQDVKSTLGVYETNTQVIYSKEQFHDYITAAIAFGYIAIDTETNNSLDPVTCKLMGLCLYTPIEQSVYIPVNHVDVNTNIRLNPQITEQDIAEELQRLSDTYIIMHNGKFDYEVIKCTTGIELHIDWDTMIGAKLLDENELSAGLKQQYIEKIDPSIEKYSIEHLFKDVEYAVVNPELFALYAATDAYMTYKLYEYQKQEILKIPSVLHLAETIEMPLVRVIAEMELAGMEVDQEYGKLLSRKYHNILNRIDADIETELNKLSEKISAWRLTPEANNKPLKANGSESKSKSEQLAEPINLASPTQLAILIYDILQAPVVNKKSPRSTGEAELKILAEQLKLPLLDLVLKRREQVKLLSTYIDTIPELASRWPDGRVRTHFNQYGAATGRLSSSEPLNFQNIPAKNKEIRMLFKAKEIYELVEPQDNQYKVSKFSEIYTDSGWKYASDCRVGDIIITDDDIQKTLKSCTQKDNFYIFEVT